MRASRATFDDVRVTGGAPEREAACLKGSLAQGQRRRAFDYRWHPYCLPSPIVNCRVYPLCHTRQRQCRLHRRCQRGYPYSSGTAPQHRRLRHTQYGSAWAPTASLLPASSLMPSPYPYGSAFTPERFGTVPPSLDCAVPVRVSVRRIPRLAACTRRLKTHKPALPPLVHTPIIGRNRGRRTLRLRSSSRSKQGRRSHFVLLLLLREQSIRARCRRAV